MFFGCTLRAPHGGIFVLPTIGNPLMYALAILIGSAAGCLVLAALKRPIKDNAQRRRNEQQGIKTAEKE